MAPKPGQKPQPNTSDYHEIFEGVVGSSPDPLLVKKVQTDA
jgi:hypothetical protein